MRSVGTLLFVALMLVGNATFAAGVNCEQQNGAVERTICSDSGLKRLSDDLEFYYQGALRVTGNVVAVEHSQAAWQSKLQQCEQQDAKKCIRTSYKNRLADLKSFAEAFRGYAGYAFKTVNLSDGNIGLEIEGIEQNSPAQSAGLQVGDVIIETGAGPIKSINDIVRINFPVVNLAEPISVLRDDAIFATQIIPRTSFRSLQELPVDIRDRVESKPESVPESRIETTHNVVWIGGFVLLLVVFLFIKRLNRKETGEEHINKRTSSKNASSSSNKYEPDDKHEGSNRFSRDENSFNSQNEQVPIDEFSGEYIREYWYLILGVLSTATQAEIIAGYKSSIGKYHPDKVATLGDDLKALADKKSKQINNAYQYARKYKGF